MSKNPTILKIEEVLDRYKFKTLSLELIKKLSEEIFERVCFRLIDDGK